VTIGLTLFGIAFLIAAAWAGGFFLHDSSQAAPISEALRRYRASDHPSGGLNGVYVYATKGSESISALGGATHAYPAKTSITAAKVALRNAVPLGRARRALDELDLLLDGGRNRASHLG